MNAPKTTHSELEILAMGHGAIEALLSNEAKALLGSASPPGFESMEQRYRYILGVATRATDAAAAKEQYEPCPLCRGEPQKRKGKGWAPSGLDFHLRSRECPVLQYFVELKHFQGERMIGSLPMGDAHKFFTVPE